MSEFMGLIAGHYEARVRAISKPDVMVVGLRFGQTSVSFRLLMFE